MRRFPHPTTDMLRQASRKSTHISSYNFRSSVLNTIRLVDDRKRKKKQKKREHYQRLLEMPKLVIRSVMLKKTSYEWSKKGVKLNKTRTSPSPRRQSGLC